MSKALLPDDVLSYYGSNVETDRLLAVGAHLLGVARRPNRGP